MSLKTFSVSGNLGQAAVRLATIWKGVSYFYHSLSILILSIL